MSSKQSGEPPFRGLRLPGDRRVFPPTVWAIFFLLVFRAVVVVIALFQVGGAPGWAQQALVAYISFVLVMSAAFTAIFMALVVRGSVLAPYVLSVIGALGATAVRGPTMFEVVAAAGDVLLVIFVWTPSARAYARSTREARRRGPRLPYRYAGPTPRREDFSTGE